MEKTKDPLQDILEQERKAYLAVLNRLDPNTKKMALLDAVECIPLRKDFKVPDGFPVPLRDKLFIYEIKETIPEENRKTEGGILLLDTNKPGDMTSTSNTIVPDIGIVYAVGPEVSDFIFPGLTVMFNPYANVEVMIKGKTYRRMDERDIYGILPPQTYVYQGVKSDAFMRRSKRIQQFNDYYIRKDAADLNTLDKKEELAKKLKKK